MAGFGTVFKNGIMYILLSAPFMYLGAFLIIHSQRYVILIEGASNNEVSSIVSSAGLFLFLGLLSIFGGGGLLYLKAVSDTVEEGVLY